MLGSLSQLHYQLVKVVAIIVVLAVSTMQECDLFARRINFTSVLMVAILDRIGVKDSINTSLATFVMDILDWIWIECCLMVQLRNHLVATNMISTVSMIQK